MLEIVGVGRMLLCAGAAAVVLACGRGGADSYAVDFGGRSVPGLTGQESSTAAVRAFLEPAPEGHAWSYGLDWDDTVVGKCLRPLPPTPPAAGRTYLRADLIAALEATEPPAGYQWWADRGGEGIVGMCVRRIGCPNGRVPNRQECIVPR